MCSEDTGDDWSIRDMPNRHIPGPDISERKPTLLDTARSLAELVESKQAAYGDSFGKSGEIMKILYPNGIPTEKLTDALTVTRIVDKLFRIATDRDAMGENPWRDIAGYALLATNRGDTK